MIFRHEIKHEISRADMLFLRQRLKAVAESDSHSENGIYTIRSLYFDTLYDKALREKTDGLNRREKFRLRIYNNDTSLIRLEKKSRINNLCCKEGTTIGPDTARLILNGNIPVTDNDLINELRYKMTAEGLMPKTIVEYTREAYVYAPGNVRVTFDHTLRTGFKCTDLLDPDCLTLPVPDDPVILEVKWDEFLPECIKAAVQLDMRQSGAFSKYAACRIYG